MKKTFQFIAFILISYNSFAQKPEKQISFAQESKTHNYYVKQAELWWQEIEKDKHSEDNWYNYFRACRNAQGSLNWKTDFIKSSSSLKFGDDIVKLMEVNIPNTFTYYYLSYLNRGIGTLNGDKLEKAYRMNPDFEDIHSSMVSYAVSSVNNTLRKSVNKDWYKKNFLSPQRLQYAYNLLMSLEKNAVLFTQNDNDSFPVWMLQDALDVRPDVLVLNVDYMLIDSHREHYINMLKIKPLLIAENDKKINDYEQNWGRIMKHILSNYSFERPLYLSLTLYPHMYTGFEDKLEISGLAQKYCRGKENLSLINEQLLNKGFMMDQVKNPILYDKDQKGINYSNLAYINMFKLLYDHYQSAHQSDKALEMKILSLELAERIGNQENIDAIKKLFES